MNKLSFGVTVKFLTLRGVVYLRDLSPAVSISVVDTSVQICLKEPVLCDGRGEWSERGYFTLRSAVVRMYYSEVLNSSRS